MNFLTKATISYKLMPVKPWQNWIIKSVSQYPITAYLWIVDFILYNWQGLSLNGARLGFLRCTDMCGTKGWPLCVSMEWMVALFNLRILQNVLDALLYQCAIAFELFEMNYSDCSQYSKQVKQLQRSLMSRHCASLSDICKLSVAQPHTHTQKHTL